MLPWYWNAAERGVYGRAILLNFLACVPRRWVIDILDILCIWRYDHNPRNGQIDGVVSQ